MIKKTISRLGDAERRRALEISARRRCGCVELVTAFNYQSNVFLFIILTDFAIPDSQCARKQHSEERRCLFIIVLL